MRDIDEYAHRAISYLDGLAGDEAAFLADSFTQDAVLRCLEVIGEAAKRLSLTLTVAYPTVPWPIMVGLRNRVIHEYHRVDLGLVYQTVRHELPGLVEQIAAILVAEQAITDH
ncbi:MAG: HepT-like ribonuclease domain-containing protein [Planctomycetota bacterium]